MHQVSVRTARYEDLQELLRLFTQLNPDDTPLDPPIASKVWQEILGNPHMECLVAESATTLAGSCTVTFVPNLTRGGRPYAVVENVVVDSTERRIGVGKALMESAVAIAKAQDCYKVILLSSSKRPEAHLFYEACGFDGNSKRGFEVRL